MNDLAIQRALHAQLSTMNVAAGRDQTYMTANLERVCRLVRDQLTAPGTTDGDRSAWEGLEAFLADQSRVPSSRQERCRATAGRIRDAVIRRRFRIVYQPIVDLRTGDTVGREALSRFGEGDTHSWFAEAAGLGVGCALELAAIDEALKDDALAGLPSGGFLSLNISPATVLSPLLTEILDAANPRAIVLELTEHARVDDPDAILEALHPLRARGLRLAIDDTGAGHASFKLILQLRPDFIKMDRFFVTDIDRDPARRALFAGSVEFARALGSRVVAEGIETAEQLDILRGLGVGLGQGYHLGRPSDLPRRGARNHTMLKDRAWDGRGRTGAGL